MADAGLAAFHEDPQLHIIIVTTKYIRTSCVLFTLTVQD
jgi:hypothetical protein